MNKVEELTEQELEVVSKFLNLDIKKDDQEQTGEINNENEEN